MIAYSHSKAIIPSVIELVIEPIDEEFDDVPLLQRQVIVRTKDGGTFTLVLQATSKRCLQVHRKHKTVWLTPQVYTGNDAGV